MIYEQPLTEQIRTCLRLEYLFAQVTCYAASNLAWDSHQAIKAILEILQTIERIDLKNKFGQILNQYLQVLSQLEALSGVDRIKLGQTIRQLDNIIDSFHINQKKIGQLLREDEFLLAIQQRMYTPAGTCGFSLPAYQLWLQQDSAMRKRQILTWFDEVKQLQEVVAIILQLVREGTTFKASHATKGFYQNTLDPNISYQLVRIKLPLRESIFPEISVGRYRLAIHFFHLDISGKTAQIPEDIMFDLACCKM